MQAHITEIHRTLHVFGYFLSNILDGMIFFIKKMGIYALNSRFNLEGGIV